MRQGQALKHIYFCHLFPFVNDFITMIIFYVFDTERIRLDVSLFTFKSSRS